MRLLNKPDALEEPLESKKPLSSMFRNSGFHYTGKDKRGVSRWHGSWDHVLRWLGLIFVCYGGVAGAAAIGMLLYALLTMSWPHVFNPLFFIALTHGVTFGGIGVWALKMRKHIQTLATPEQLSAQFDVPAGALEQAAFAKGIKPRMSINDVDYYNPADFAGEAMTLLRGASEPAMTADVLLRPANGNSSDAPAELLRTDMPAQPDYVATDRYTTDTLTQAVQARQE